MTTARDRDRTLGFIRKICLALPETSERLSHGAPTFFVRKRTFVMVLNDHHGDGRFAIWCAAGEGMQAMLVEADPERFFVPPYVGYRGWLGFRLDRELDQRRARRARRGRLRRGGAAEARCAAHARPRTNRLVPSDERSRSSARSPRRPG